ncbi:ABC transporter permease [Corynebacterium aquilae]|uniref:ABC transporter permease n=1 Tax=Corynebacterium aquilae DSM 44791 TaxID=1431546 RepID=A0A1L7CHB5_9CORY|nr:ABC transporter permease [Corynebacterium aquilae]APT85219.1 ABC transporter permease [Corynebacterium aquilae DSM 44791]
MAARILRHILRYAITIFLASVAIFFMLRIVPGDPAEIALGVNATEETLAAKRAELGTDRPLLAQYADWIKGLFTGDFGISLTSGADISPLVIDRMQVSLILVGCGMLLSLAIAIPLGTWAAYRAKKTDGHLITAASQVGIAIPSFLAGILLVTVFAVKLGWLPANGWVPFSHSPSEFIARLILPVLALSAVQGAIMTRYVRSAVLDILSENFMRTARAKGMSVAQALRVHGLRNAALPVVTVVGVQLATVIVGAVVIERVFVLPGLGTMLLDAVTNRDLPTVQTIVMVLVLFTLIVNLIVDLAYVVLDPRMRAR